MKIYNGIIKKVPTHEQFEKFSSGNLDLNTVTLFDTVQSFDIDERTIEYINIRLTYKEVDEKGNEKFIYDEYKREYEKVYKRTPILRAYGKEMRIILDIGEYAPVKIIADEQEKDGFKFYSVVAIQDQRMGKVISE